MSSVRDLVGQCQRELLTTDVQPDRAATLLAKMTALLGNVNQEIRQADSLYAQTLLGHLNSAGSAAKARIMAETTQEYDRKREARDTKELVTEMIRSLKYILRAAEEEMRLAR